MDDITISLFKGTFSMIGFLLWLGAASVIISFGIVLIKTWQISIFKSREYRKYDYEEDIS
jgi:hypothetical protein